MIYLDNAATTGTKPDTVIQAVAESMKNLSVNAGRGSYSAARKAVQIIDECRTNLLTIGKITSGYHVFFSPSATIAFNQIILGLDIDCYSDIYVSPFEHNAVMRPLYAIANRTDAKVRVIPFDKASWSMNTQETESMFLSHNPKYVFISMVSNTTGYILPVKEIVDISHKYGAKVIVDCAQAFGAIDVDLLETNADIYVFAGHKTLYGPYGIAGFIIKNSFKFRPGIYGGTGSDSLNLNMPSADAGGFEPGSANIPAICGLNEAVKWLQNTGIKKIQEHESMLINLIIDKLKDIDKVKLYVPPKEYRSGIVALNVDGYLSQDVGDILDDEYGIAVRTGYQCAPLVHDWLGTKTFSGIVRISVSFFTSEDDVIKLIDALKTL